MASIKKKAEKQKQPEAVNLFANAAEAPLPAPKKPAGKKDDRKEISFGSDIDTFAAINTVMKSLKTISDTIESDIKQRAIAEYIELGTEIGKKPDNFRAMGERSSAVIQLKKRSSSSQLSEDEVKVLNEIGIEAFEHEEVNIEARYFFNPEIMNDPKIMKILSEKISEAVADVPELAGKSIIMLQPAQKISKMIVDDSTIDAVFKLEDEDDIEKALKITTSTAISAPVLNDDVDLTTAFDLLRGVVKAK